jgi:hydroxymethylpyrimidine pyrophosphatase-like HAD family hydrolase
LACQGLLLRKNWSDKEQLTNMNDRPLTIAVDFDGVIADYDGWKGNQTFGSPRSDVIEALQVLRSEGWKIVIYSTRGVEEIKPYLIANTVPFDEINQNSSYRTGGTKPVATVYWDDRACRYSGNARDDLQVIREFRTWSGRS